MSLWPYAKPDDAARARLADRLARASDPAALGAAVVAARIALPLDPTSLAIRTIAVRTDRFVLAIDGRDGTGAPVRVAAKGYSDDRAAAIEANHRRVWAAVPEGRSATVRTNEPLGVVPSMGLALSEWVDGAHPTAADTEAAGRAGRAAAWLHASRVALARPVPFAGFVDNLDRRMARLGRRDPDLGAAGASIARVLRLVAPTLPFETTVPVHGDLSLTSFVLTAERTVLIDWDTAGRFDPAWDVALHLTQLLRHAAEDGIAADGPRDAFIEAYREGRRGGLGRGWERRLGFFEVAACLHKAHAAMWTGRDDWSAVAARLLARAEEVVATAGWPQVGPTPGALANERRDRRARRFGAMVLGVPIDAAAATLLTANRPRRAVYRVETADRAVIVKSFETRGRASLASLRLAAFGGVVGVGVPTPLRADIEGRLLAMSVLGGRDLLEVFRGPDAFEAADRLGRAVASLHRHPAVLPSRRSRAIATRVPRDPWRLAEDERRIAAAVAAARATLAGSPRQPAVPSHGDLGPAQVLLDDTGIAILDFDRATMAEPALDLGNLLAQMVRRNGRRGFALHHRLVHGYAAVRPAPSFEVVRAYALAILVRKLVRRTEAARAPFRETIDLLLEADLGP